MKPGIDFKLVERAAGMSQAAAADHGNRHAGGGCKRRQHKRSLVAHAAGGMLVDFLRRQRREIEHFARVQHRIRQRSSLGSRHAPQHHRHQPRGNLIVRDIAARVSVHQGFDFVRATIRRHPAFCGSHRWRGKFGLALESDSLEAKSFRKQFGDVSLLRAVSALEEDRRVGAEFVNHLAARAARRAGHSLIVDYRDGANLDLRAQAARPPKKSPCARRSWSFRRRRSPHCSRKRFCRSRAGWRPRP